jgi:hypothetical protein
VEAFESLLSTTFYQYRQIPLEGEEDSGEEPLTFFRAKEYSLPLELRDLVGAVFNTLQFPSLFRHRQTPSFVSHSAPELPSQLRRNFGKHSFSTSSGDGSIRTEEIKTAATTPTGYVDLSLLNSFYDIVSNNGSSLTSQAIFVGKSLHLGYTDLTNFLKDNGFKSPLKYLPPATGTAKLLYSFLLSY